MGKIKAKNIKARHIVTGIKIDGAVSDETLQTALKLLESNTFGDIIVEENIEASGDVVSGFQYTNAAQFNAGLTRLRENLQTLTQQPDVPAEARDALDSLDDAIAEAKRPEPRRTRLINRLKETLEYITTAGKALDAAKKAGPIIAQAVATAAALYQAAQTLF